MPFSESGTSYEIKEKSSSKELKNLKKELRTPEVVKKFLIKKNPTLGAQVVNADIFNKYKILSIKGLQKALGYEGYNPGKKDGIYGSLTEKALLAYINKDNPIKQTPKKTENNKTEKTVNKTIAKKNTNKPTSPSLNTVITKEKPTIKSLESSMKAFRDERDAGGTDEKGRHSGPYTVYEIALNKTGKPSQRKLEYKKRVNGDDVQVENIVFNPNEKSDNKTIQANKLLSFYENRYKRQKNADDIADQKAYNEAWKNTRSRQSGNNDE